MHATQTISCASLDAGSLVRGGLITEDSGRRLMDRLQGAQLVIIVDLGWQIGESQYVGLRQRQRVLLQYVQS